MCQSYRAAEVGDDHDERALHRETVHDPQRLAERAVAGRHLAQAAEREQKAAAALARPAPVQVLGPERDQAEPVAAPRRHVADGERDAFGDVGLPPLGGAERHRRRGVEDEPRHEHPLGELDADVRRAGTRGHVPVDAADVVARLVRPDLEQLAAEPREGRAVVAGEEAVDPPPDREVERAQATRP